MQLMTLTDLTVIYFAYGSPFGVYQVTRVHSLRSARSAAAIAAHFVLWPIFAAANLRNWLSGNGEATETNLEEEIGSIRSKLESIAYIDATASSVFKFREIFARFTGLTMALNGGRAANLSKDMFKIGGNENIILASACLDRRNRHRLAFHQKQARSEFDAFIASMARSHRNGDEIVELGLQLAELLNGEAPYTPRLPSPDIRKAYQIS